MREKRIIIGCVIVVLCFIVIGVIGKRIAKETATETNTTVIETIENETTLK